tara:strand:+ start:89 stop:1570 length:1482 start_codon:yes stop_codon:yes gene_type:complete
MGGGLMQLVAYGAQDVYLTGEPQITFFKVVYRRHTNFSVEPIVQTFSGASEFGRTVTCNVNRNGDLISKMYVVVDLEEWTPANGSAGYVSRLGHALIESAKVEIGGSKIDEQYGDWLNIWYELTRNNSHDRGYDNMIGNNANMTAINGAAKPESRLYVPLQFWFNRNNGLALPLIALQYHDVRMTIKFRDVDDCVNGTSTNKPRMKDANLLIDYIYLDTEERKRFAQAQHEYLIEQLQFTGSESVPSQNNKFRLNFNHPSKFLTWSVKAPAHVDVVDWAHDGDWDAALERAAAKLLKTDTSFDNTGEDDATTLAQITDHSPATFTLSSGGNVTVTGIRVGDEVQVISHNLTVNHLSDSSLVSQVGSNAVHVHDHFNYGSNLDGTANRVDSSRLQLNGHERFTERDGAYFNYVQPYQHFSNTPCDGVNVYSFALEPEKHQPSGTCNFSRIDNTTLNVNLVDSPASDANLTINIYTVNYNVLRVMSGMAGVAYSN